MRWKYALQHPAFLLQFVTCPDSRSGDTFQFELLSEEECDLVDAPYRKSGWEWQREYIDWCEENDQTVTLKGRQLGVSWVWDGLLLADVVLYAGIDDLVYSIKEDDAAEQINRIWDMYLTLPSDFTDHLNVIKPFGGSRPSNRIELEHPDGRISTITGMPATKKAGHSRVARRVLFDEAAHQEYARELWKALVPAAGDKGGKMGAVSTANGMSDGRGLGNFFHELWIGSGRANYPNVKRKFLSWRLHPDRNDAWYAKVPLDAASKAEQYPDTPDEAFLLSGTPFFATDALYFYAKQVVEPVKRGGFRPMTGTPSTGVWDSQLPYIEVFRLPEEGHRYVMACDVAKGTGLDFSVGAVIDLSDGAPVAEIHMQATYEDFSEQVHFLALWYKTPRLAIEVGGGFGDTVIAHLRDGHKGRKAYPRLYRHRSYRMPTRPQTEQLGFPMNAATRPKVIDGLATWINDKLIPWIPEGLLDECKTFVRRETSPSPRAADGANDDRVMAYAIAYEMYSEYAEHPHSTRKKALATPYKPPPMSSLDPRAKRRQK